MKKYMVDNDGIYSSIRFATNYEIKNKVAVTFTDAKKEILQYARNRKFEYQMFEAQNLLTCIGVAQVLTQF